MLSILGKILFSLVLSYLQKRGDINAIEAKGIIAGTHILKAIENLQTEDTFPPDKVTGIVQGGSLP